MVANAVVSGYLILSLPLAFVHIVKKKTENSRILLIVLDVVSHQQTKLVLSHKGCDFSLAYGCFLLML